MLLLLLLLLLERRGQGIRNAPRQTLPKLISRVAGLAKTRESSLDELQRVTHININA